MKRPTEGDPSPARRQAAGARSAVLTALVLVTGLLVSGLAVSLWFEGDTRDDPALSADRLRQQLLFVAFFAAPAVAGVTFVGALLVRRTARWSAYGLLTLVVLGLAVLGVGLLD